MTLPEIIDQALELSKADACIVIAQHSSTANLRWANNTSTTNGLADNQELFVISIKDRRVGVAGTSAFEGDRLKELVRASEFAASHQPQAEDYTDLLPSTPMPADWHDQPQPTDIGVFENLAKNMAKIFEQAEGSGTKLFGYAEHNSVTTYLGTSTGLKKRYHGLKGHLELNAKSADYERSAWTGQATRSFTDIDLSLMYKRLSQRLEWSQTRIDLPAGRYETLLEPGAVADLLIYAYWTMSARDAAEGRTVFSAPNGKTKIGQKLCREDINLYSDPAAPNFEVTPFEVTIASSSYASVFDNGAELERTDWIKSGQLEHLITPRYWAAKTKTSVRPYIDNLLFDADGPELEEMIKNTERGLLVTCLWYIREVDPQSLLLTGLTRDGVFLIENGQVKGAVNNFRFNMSPVAMLNQTIEVGRSQAALAREWGDYFTFAKMPPLRVRDFNMSSVSQAK
jgi:predicted Zn-dependent protease